MSDHYCNRTDVNNAWGATNVESWADLDAEGSTTAITSRVVWAIDAEAERIDGKLRHTHYDVPVYDASGDPPKQLRILNADLAGIRLYECKGSMDSDPQTGKPIHKLALAKDSAEKRLDDFRDYKEKFDVNL